MSYRFAIVGCGSIASRHADQIRSAGLLIAVCDLDPLKADDFARKYGALPFYSIESMLNAADFDVVVVCTPNGLHAEHAIKALGKGCHVLCEKPLSLSVADGGKMINAAERAGRKLFVVKQNRFNKPVLAVRRLLDEGRLGTVTGFQVNCFWNRPAAYYQNSSWRGTRLLDGGTLFTQFSHFIDLLQWFLGDILSVSGWRANFLHKNSIEFEDTGSAAIVMKTGAIGSLHYTINAHLSNMEGSLSLFGEKGTVKIGGQYLNRIDYFSVENETAPPDDPAGANDYGYYKGSMSHHDIVYRELIKALNDPGHLLLQAPEALKSVAMIEQIYAASPFIQTTSE